MTDKNWKAFERRVARILGGRRIPVTGERDGADVLTRRLAVQVKKGRRFPYYLDRWIAGIRDAADRDARERDGVDPRVGLVVWQKKGGADREALAVLAVEDLVALIGKEEVEDGGDDPDVVAGGDPGPDPGGPGPGGPEAEPGPGGGDAAPGEAGGK